MLTLRVKVANDKTFHNDIKTKILKANKVLYNNKDASVYWSQLLTSIYEKESQSWDAKKDLPIHQKTKRKGGTEIMMEHLRQAIDISKYNIITDATQQAIDKTKSLIYWCHDMPSDPRYRTIDKNHDICVCI